MVLKSSCFYRPAGWENIQDFLYCRRHRFLDWAVTTFSNQFLWRRSLEHLKKSLGCLQIEDIAALSKDLRLLGHLLEGHSNKRGEGGRIRRVMFVSQVRPFQGHLCNVVDL
jgi:hypothetical protein